MCICIYSLYMFAWMTYVSIWSTWSTYFGQWQDMAGPSIKRKTWKQLCVGFTTKKRCGMVKLELFVWFYWETIDMETTFQQRAANDGSPSVGRAFAEVIMKDTCCRSTPSCRLWAGGPFFCFFFFSDDVLWRSWCFWLMWFNRGLKQPYPTNGWLEYLTWPLPVFLRQTSPLKSGCPFFILSHERWGHADKIKGY